MTDNDTDIDDIDEEKLSELIADLPRVDESAAADLDEHGMIDLVADLYRLAFVVDIEAAQIGEQARTEGRDMGDVLAVVDQIERTRNLLDDIEDVLDVLVEDMDDPELTALSTSFLEVAVSDVIRSLELRRMLRDTRQTLDAAAEKVPDQLLEA